MYKDVAAMLEGYLRKPLTQRLSRDEIEGPYAVIGMLNDLTRVAEFGTKEDGTLEPDLKIRLAFEPSRDLTPGSYLDDGIMTYTAFELSLIDYGALRRLNPGKRD